MYKCYILLFTCCVTRAVHLEVTVEDNTKVGDQGLFLQPVTFYCSHVLAYCSLASNPRSLRSYVRNLWFFYDNPYCSLIYICQFPICGLRLALPGLKFYRHLLWKQSLVPDPSFIIRRLENEFDSCHLSLFDHLDQKIRAKLLFFSHLF